MVPPYRQLPRRLINRPMSEYTYSRLIRLGSGELANRLLTVERVRKHWRILAIRAALGLIDVDVLKGVCFKELLGVVPEEADLDAALEKLTDELEAMETDQTDILEMFGKGPRVIDLSITD